MKYYYTDPLKAAWMAREFGVRFTGFSTKDRWIEMNLVTDGDVIISNTSDDYYIHPDSLAIFEPQDGDKDIDGFAWDAERTTWVRQILVDGSDQTCVFEETSESSTISTRNGKLFFWPEVEND